jgi:hypothetical protein
VPTIGLVIRDNSTSFVYSSDTGEIDALSEVLNTLAPRSVYSWNAVIRTKVQVLAQESKHLTPADIKRLIAKTDRQFPIRIYHSKPMYFEQILNEISDLNHHDIQHLKEGEIYRI